MIRNVARLSYVLIACGAVCINFGCPPGGGTSNPAAVLEGTWNATDDAGKMFVLVFNSEGRLVRIEGEADDGQDVMVTINNATTEVDGDNVTITIPVNDAEAEFVGTLSNNDNTLTGSVSRSIEIGEDLIITIAQGDVTATREDDGNGNGNGNDNEDNGNDNGDGGVTGDFTFTDFAVHVQGRIAVGGNLVAYTGIGTDRSQGVVEFFQPFQVMDGARPIENGERFDPDSFGVIGNDIVLVENSGDRAFGLTFYSVTLDVFDEVPIEDIRLVNIPIGNYATGFIDTDGNLVATRNDTPDDIIVKVVEYFSGLPPVVIPLSVNPGGTTSGFSVQQVAVDAETRRVVAVSNDVFYVYDIDMPDADPRAIDVSGMGGIKDEIIAFDGGAILYADDDDGTVFLLDVLNPDSEPMAISTPDRGATQLNLHGNNFGFLFEGPASQGQTAAIGVFPGDPNVSDGDTILENTANLGRFGYGDTLVVTGSQDNPLWFLGGRDDVGTPDALQQSTDGINWMLTADREDPTIFQTASDVTTDPGREWIVFKYEVNDEQFIGFGRVE